MKTNLMIILLMVLFPSCAFSGEIYGCIKKDGKFVGKGVEIKITPDSNKGNAYLTNTDVYGTYRLYVPETESCKLNMKYKERPVYIVISEEKTQDFLVYYYEGSVQYDFFIKEENGEYFLRRK